mgnify:FL=1
MGERIDRVLVVGGGDAGLLTALSLRKMNPRMDVSVVDDFDREIPAVGKSTFQAIFRIFHDTLGFDEQTFVSEVKPVWKASVYFDDWCGRTFHYPFDLASHFPPADTDDAIANYYLYYDELTHSPDHLSKCEQMVEQGKSPWYFSPSDGGNRKYENVAYHLNTERFNAYLRDRCREQGISLVDDDVVDVDVTGDRIDRVRSDDRAYEADLYVDATGFNRVLKEAVGGEFVDFELPLDSALNARVDRPLSEVVPATVVDSGEHGWFWQIDTYDNRDLGYVYASEFADDEEAMAAFLEHCDGAVSPEEVASYEFSSGYYDPAWTGNCVAIGNAQGFVEPLESTGLTAAAKSAVTLSNLLSARGGVSDAGVRETYNDWVGRSWRSIYDFIAVHYRYADGDNEFWRAMRSIPTSARVERIVEAFDRNGFDTHVDPVANDVEVEDLVYFRPRNFYTLLRDLGETAEFYESYEFDVGEPIRKTVDRYYENIESDVASHYSTKELYKGVLDH